MEVCLLRGGNISRQILLHSPERGINPLPPISKSSLPLLGSPLHFLKSYIPPPYRQIGHPKFSLLTEMQLKFSSVKILSI